ncbi:MAG TPA: MFS transporter [candidate division Zixibacteria bacterium]|nr:MFS transporter [candidate division Zixibacteria bacterium]
MEGVLRRDRWLLSICVGRVFAYSNFMVYAACLPILRERWQMSATEAGTISSGFMVGYTISLVAFSWLAERVGARRVFVLSAFATAAGAVAFGFFARGYASALLLYTLSAMTQGGNYTPAIMIMAERYRADRRGRAVGWLIASTSAGYAFSLATSGLLLALGDYTLAFVGTGLLPSLGALILWRALRDVPNRVHRPPRHGETAAALLGNVRARQLVAAYTCHCWELLGMWSWAPAFLAASLTLSGTASAKAAEAASYLVAAMHLVGALAASTMGHLSDLWGRGAVLLLLAAAGTVVSLGIGWLVGGPPFMMIALILVYGFVTIGDSPVLSTALTEAVAPAHLGSALAIRSLLGFGAGAVAPTAFGLALDAADLAGFGPPAAWGSAFAVLAIGGAGAAWNAWRFAREPRCATGNPVRP